MPDAIDRIFLGWDAPALHTAAAHLADRYAGERELRMDGAVVAFPGARAGRRFVEVLLDEAEARGLRLVPPRVTTIGRLPELLYLPARPAADAVLTRRVWTRALRALGRERLERLFPRLPDDAEPGLWAALARQIEGLHREVGGAGLRFDEVAERCREGMLFDDGDRWTVLAEAQAGYLAELDELGREDREFARIRALGRGEVEGEGDVWLVGIVEMPGIVRRMLAAVDAPVRALVHAPADRADAFDDAGCVRPEAWLEAEIPLPDEHLAVGDRPSDQAAEAIRGIAGFGGRYSPEELTIGVPDDQVVPYIEQRLSAAGDAVRYAEGVRLHRTAPYRLLAAFADYLDGRRFDALAALVRHPDLRRWLRGAGAGAADGDAPVDAEGSAGVLDAYFREAYPARVAGSLPGDGPVRAAADAVVRAIESKTLLGPLRGTRRLSEWAPEILTLLVRVYGAEPLDRGDPAERRIVEACERIGTVAASFHDLPETVDEREPAAAAIRLLLAEVQHEMIPPHPDRAAIELLGWLELHLDDAPALVVTGMNEPHLPESVSADPFLPNALRSRLGLADNELRYARDAYQLTAILHSRSDVRVVAGRRDATGDPLRPSRLLFAVPGGAVAERVRWFYDGEEASAAGPAIRARAGETSRFGLPPEPVLHAPEPIDSLRVTDFRLLLRDPYRFALQRILRLEPLDDDATELDGAVFGALAHEVLHRFGESGDAHATDAARIRDALDTLLDDAVGRRFGRSALPAVMVQVEQLRARLHAFAAWQAGWIADGWRIVAVEQQPEGAGVPFDVDGEPVRLRGRIDRIDRNEETGEWAVFDYKTSDRAKAPDKTHRKGRGDEKEWVDLQLPLYRHLLPALPLDEAPDPAGVRLGYILLPRELDRVGDETAEWGAAELGEADAAARAAVRALRENRFVFDPERMESFPGDPLAALVGAGRLDATDATDEGGTA